jgi:hypothetical protein
MRFVNALAASALLIAGTVPVAAASPTGEAKLAKILDGRVAGQPVDCIYLPRIRSTQVVNGTAIVYDAGPTIYVNRPASGAETLSSSDVLVTKTHIAQLCSIDIVRLFDQGTPRIERGFVNLGSFVPYTKVAKAHD